MSLQHGGYYANSDFVSGNDGNNDFNTIQGKLLIHIY